MEGTIRLRKMRWFLGVALLPHNKLFSISMPITLSAQFRFDQGNSFHPLNKSKPIPTDAGDKTCSKSSDLQMASE
jgi:hypothetical protein